MEQQVFVFDKYGLSMYMGYQCTVDVSLFLIWSYSSCRLVAVPAMQDLGAAVNY